MRGSPAIDRVVAECAKKGPLTSEQIGELLGAPGREAVARIKRSLSVEVAVVGTTGGKKGCIRKLYRVEAANG